MNKQIKLTILIFCLINLVLHIIADTHSGFQGDELLHIETGEHLAFGYMEFPPLIGLLAFIQNLFGSNTVFVHHVFCHIASLLIIIYVAKTTIELGGKVNAVFFILLALLIAPGLGRSQQLFQPVVFSQLFWVLSFYQLVRFVKSPGKKYLWYLTAFCIAGFLTKYDSVFFLFGLLSLLFFKRTREALIKQRVWVNMLVFIICISPNIIWQYSNDFPVLQMFGRLYDTQLEELSRLEILKKILIDINPLSSLLLLLPGIIYLLASKNKPVYRPLALAVGLSFFLLLFKNGKAYYFYPLLLTLLPFGALFWEQQIISRRRWIIYPVSIVLFLGIALVPFGMPVYSFDRYLDKIYPFEKKEVRGGQFAIRYDEYYTAEKWRVTMREVKYVYDSLPAGEKKNCIIWGKHYAQAGAVSLFGKDLDLPGVFSFHGSFYSWAPSGEMPQTVIALSYQVGTFFSPYFEEIIPVRKIYNPYSDDEEELYQVIYICRRPRQDFGKMKELFKKRIFE